MNYQEKKENRINYYKEQANKAAKTSDQLINRASEMASHIPFGQPILIGHHSEERDRNYRNRIHSIFGKGFEESKKADYYESKVEAAINNNAISSDDPEALTLLKEKLQKLETEKEFKKAVNKYYKKNKTFVGMEGLSTESAESLTKKMNILQHNELPFPAYVFANLNGNIKRIKERIQHLEAHKDDVTKVLFENDNIKIVDDVEENRVMIFFDSIPAQDVRDYLKSYGFKWSPRNSAWQRMRGNIINQYALKVVEKFNLNKKDGE